MLSRRSLSREMAANSWVLLAPPVTKRELRHTSRKSWVVGTLAVRVLKTYAVLGCQVRAVRRS